MREGEGGGNGYGRGYGLGMLGTTDPFYSLFYKHA